MQPSELSACSIVTAADAFSNLSLTTNNTTSLSPSTFPLNILVKILKRIPVKSILCLKHASKPWRSYLSTPEFISMHLKETAIDPQNHSFLIYYLNHQHLYFMCRLNINSTDSQVEVFMHPFLNHLFQMDLVGSINGVVCLSDPPQGQKVLLWNPALMVKHEIWRSEHGLFWGGDVIDKVSLGLAYDSVTDDYKVVRIGVLISNAISPIRNAPIMPKPDYVLPSRALYLIRAEVYSLNLGDWETVDMKKSPLFNVSSTRCNAIVNGIPYWIGKLYDKSDIDQRRSTDVLIWYDMIEKSFKHLPKPKMEPGTGAKLVDWKGKLGMILYTRIGSYVDLLLFDEKEACWNLAFKYGPIGVKMEKIIQCTKDGVILGETQGGKLFVYHHLSNAVKEYSAPPRSVRHSYKALSHTDSMVSSEKFEPCFECL